MKKLLMVLGISSLLLFSCSDDDDSSSSPANNNTNTVSGVNPDTLSAALILPSGVQQVKGGLPAAADPVNAPTLMMDSVFTLSNGSTSISGSYGNAKRRLGGASVQVSGASYHYKVPVQISNTNQDSSSGDISFTIGLRPGVTSEDVDIEMNIYDIQKTDYYSKVQKIKLKQESNSPGKYLRVKVSWPNDQDGSNNQDLTINDPNDRIFTLNSNGTNPAATDLDDYASFSWLEGAPEGNYSLTITDVSPDQQGYTTATLEIFDNDNEQVHEETYQTVFNESITVSFSYVNGVVNVF